jgi:hypothetical protein
VQSARVFCESGLPQPPVWLFSRFGLNLISPEKPILSLR